MTLTVSKIMECSAAKPITLSETVTVSRIVEAMSPRIASDMLTVSESREERPFMATSETVSVSFRESDSENTPS